MENLEVFTVAPSGGDLKKKTTHSRDAEEGLNVTLQSFDRGFLEICCCSRDRMWPLGSIGGEPIENLEVSTVAPSGGDAKKKTTHCSLKNIVFNTVLVRGGGMLSSAGRKVTPAMNPVASGDNLWLQGLPPLVPCCEGKELQIDEECIRCGLSAISVREVAAPRRRAAAACCSDTTPTQQALKARNSFRCVHRPELRRVAGLRHLSPADLRLALLQDHTPRPGVESTERAVDAAREVPVGMRLHRARLFTAVLAAAARPQSTVCTEDFSTADDAQEDESLTNERVQIILPPRTDEVLAECRTTDTRDTRDTRD